MGDKLANVLIVFIMVVILGLGGIFYTKVADGENYALENSTTYSQMLQENGNTALNQEDNDIIESIIDTNYTMGTKEYMELHNNRYYYKNLDDGAKAIYDAILNNIDKLKTGNAVINIDYDFREILNNGNGRIDNYYEDAINAVSLDVPYLFYINFSKMELRVETKTNIFGATYKLYINSGGNENYFADGFDTSTQVDVALSQIELAKEQIKTTINGTDYDKVCSLHDLLIEYMEYSNASNQKATIYGGLIEKKGVCEAYARIYKTILDEMGIENILVTGTATNSNKITEEHMWNDVKLNGKWYAVDVTWDDPIIIGGGHITSDIKHRYFLKGSQDFYTNHSEKLTISRSNKVFPLPVLDINNYR